MSSQIKFYNRNKLDLSNQDASITVTDNIASDNGQSIVNFVRNRNNNSAWITTESTDAAQTTLEIELGLEYLISNIFIVGHNLKSFTFQYWDGFNYVEFSTPISETINTRTTNFFEFNPVSTQKLKLVIYGTQVADSDKSIKQLILTDKVGVGKLVGWPQIKNPTHDTNKKITKMLSGKVNVVESVGAFSIQLSVSNWSIDSDLSLIEEVYFGRRGVLVLLSGEDELQFRTKRIGYRDEDIYFMRCVNDYVPEYNVGIYSNGLKITMNLTEAIT
jgi:hypothetical protein